MLMKQLTLALIIDKTKRCISPTIVLLLRGERSEKPANNKQFSPIGSRVVPRDEIGKSVNTFTTVLWILLPASGHTFTQTLPEIRLLIGPSNAVSCRFNHSPLLRLVLASSQSRPIESLPGVYGAGWLVVFRLGGTRGSASREREILPHHRRSYEESSSL